MNSNEKSVTTANGNAFVKIENDGTIHVTTTGNVSVSKSPKLRR